MANQKITAMPVATAIADADIATIVQGGANKQVTALILLKTPQDAAAAAQAAADAAQSTADDALPLAGGTMTGALVAALGAAAATSIAFVGDLGTGIYRVSAGILGFSSGGTLAAQIDPAGTTMSAPGTVVTQEKGDAAYLKLGFKSTQQTITTAGLLTLTHSMSPAPESATFELVCITAEHGWAVGDRLILTFTSARENPVFFPNPTDIGVRFSSQATCFSSANKATGVFTALTNANWELIVRAFA